MLIYGQSRSGKSRALEVFQEQDIFAGYFTVFIDPKGDEKNLKRCIVAAARAGRLDKLRILHLGFIAESIVIHFTISVVGRRCKLHVHRQLQMVIMIQIPLEIVSLYMGVGAHNLDVKQM